MKLRIDKTSRAERLCDYALTHLEQGNRQEAILNFHRALKIDRDWHQADLELGRLFVQDGDDELGQEHLRRVLRHSTDPKLIVAADEVLQALVQSRSLIEVDEPEDDDADFVHNQRLGKGLLDIFAMVLEFFWNLA